MTLAQKYNKFATHFFIPEVLYLIGDGNYTLVCFCDDSKALYSQTLQGFQKRYPELIRIHKGLCINPESITDWRRENCKTLRIEVGTACFSVSRRRVNNVLARLMQQGGWTLNKHRQPCMHIPA